MTNSTEVEKLVEEVARVMARSHGLRDDNPNIDLWRRDARTVAAVISPRIEAQAAEIARLRELLADLKAFVAVMYGQGPDAIIPEKITTPLGLPVNIGAIMRDAQAALAATEQGEG